MTRKGLGAGLKFLALAAIVTAVGWNLRTAWHSVGIARLKESVAVDWRWAGLSLLGCAGVTLTGATVWMALLRRLDHAGAWWRLYGAYFFSQLGKYVPGKVMLVLMRVERTSGLGVSSRATAISTIVENAAYMASAAAAGAVILIAYAISRGSGAHLGLVLAASAALAVILAAMHPRVFYRLLDPVLRGLGRPEIEPGHRLPMRALLASVIMMTPCWCFGGLALWSTTRCVLPVDFEHFGTFLSAFALSVLFGMISLLPGGLGAREVLQGLLLLPVLMMGESGVDALARAKVLATMVVLLQRVFQIGTEAALGGLGGWLTASSPSGNWK